MRCGIIRELLAARDPNWGLSGLYLPIFLPNNGLGTVYTFYIGYIQTDTGLHGRWTLFLFFALSSLRL
jgi:hypothetical protein